MITPLAASQWRAWHGDEFPHDCWRVEGEELHAIAGMRRIDLISLERYRDFVLRLEFALPAGGNSGLFCRVEEDADLSWHSGPEMQLLDDREHSDGREPTTRNGALYGLLRPELETPIEPEQFIEAVLSVRGGEVEHWLDGRRVLRYRLDDPALHKRIADSKFSGYPRFAKATEGHLVIQHHGEAARFRRLSIETPDRTVHLDPSAEISENALLSRLR
ncbi:3-keto-disaccharide hydrolase [Stutzerimonas xanthomarina]|uniref:3-keto-disaccharide hydrolase n=1 Tax=Stutzerimonas xanthomarina TaxID=271420 RepID=UPI003AA8410F